MEIQSQRLAEREEACTKMLQFNKLGHKLAGCYGPEGGKEGQGPHQKNQKHQKGGKQEDSTGSANIISQSEMMKEGGPMFTFSTTSSFHCISTKLGIPAE